MGAGLRVGDVVSSPARLRSAIRLPWVMAGLAMLALDLISLFPGSPLFDFNRGRHRQLATIFAHVAVLVVLVGLWPARRKWLEAVARARPARRGVAIMLAAALPVSAVAAVGVRWPAFAHALCKEWGIVEPMTVGVYLAGAWVAVEVARRRRRLALPWRPFGLAAALCVALALEETDYFGIPATIIGGRIGRVYVGSLHDLVNLATWYPAVLPLLGAGGLVAGAAAWRCADLSLRFLWAEARQASSWIMVLGALVLVAAEVLDITATVPSGLKGFFRADVEEPLELGAAVLLSAGMVLKYCRDRAVGPSHVC